MKKVLLVRFAMKKKQRRIQFENELRKRLEQEKKNIINERKLRNEEKRKKLVFLVFQKV